MRRHSVGGAGDTRKSKGVHATVLYVKDSPVPHGTMGRHGIT